MTVRRILSSELEAKANSSSPGPTRMFVALAILWIARPNSNELTRIARQFASANLVDTRKSGARTPKKRDGG